MPIYLPRDLIDAFQADVVEQEGRLIKEDIARDRWATERRPPSLPVPEASPPSPQPPPAPAPAPEPAPLPEPPSLESFLDMAGLVPSGAAPSAGSVPPLPAAPSAGPPALGDFLNQAFGGAAEAVGSAARGAVETVGAAAPPPLQDFLREAGVLEQPAAAPAPAAAAQPAVAGTPTPAAAGSFADISQFGDPELSQEEAYAACGPVAAIRFVQRFGRNPTRREAVDLAKLEGWTPGQGMAGIASEQRLLRRMGVEAELIQGAQWDRFAQEAQTGNPLIISTSGHYFTVDGYDPNTRRYHVGKSGEDLSGGSAWMTAEEMTRLMGQVQGALFANNPTVAAPSTATGGAEPQRAPIASTQTTAGMSGGGDLSGRVGERGNWIMGEAAKVAGWLGEQGQKALQAVLLTEGGLNNARGDGGQSAGPLQFYAGGGQLNNLMREMGWTVQQAMRWVEENPIEAIKWAIGTPERPGYLGRVIQEGIRNGLAGPDLATHAQRRGQVSVSPERAGQNWQTLFGGGQSTYGGGGGGAGGFAGDETLARRATELANQPVVQPVDLGADPEERTLLELDRRMAERQRQTEALLQQGRSEQEARSVAAAEAARPQLQTASVEPPKPIWQQIGDTIGSSIAQGLQPIVEMFQGGGPKIEVPPLQPPLEAAGQAIQQGVGHLAQAVTQDIPQTIRQATGETPEQAAAPTADYGNLGPSTGPGISPGETLGHIGEFFGGPSERRPSGGPGAGPLIGGAREVTGVQQQVRDFEERTGVPYAQYEAMFDRYGQGDEDFDRQLERLQEVWNSLAGQSQRAFEAYARAPAGEQTAAELTGAIPQAIASTALLPGGIARTGAGLARAGASLAVDPAGIPFVAGGEVLGTVARGLGRVGVGRPTGAAPTAEIVSRTGTDVRPGLYAPGEAGTYAAREELPNVQVWESHGGRYSAAEGEGGYHAPANAPLTPETAGRKGEERIRQVIADLEFNPRFPRDLTDPDANQFASELRKLGEGMATGDWKPEQTALSAILTRLSQGRPQTPARALYEGLGEEWVLRHMPSLQTQGAVPGGRPAAYGVVVRPEVLATHLAGDMTDPEMAQLLVALGRPALDELPAGTAPEMASFATRAERQAAIDRGTDHLMEQMRRGGQSGPRGDDVLIKGEPIVRKGVTMGATGRQGWADTLPSLHQKFLEWGQKTGRYAGLDEAARKDALLEDIQNAKVAGIGVDKATFVPNMGFAPDYATLDLRMRRMGFGLSPKAKLTRAERNLLERKIVEAAPEAEGGYVAQWLPWAYMTDEKTDYRSIPRAYNAVGEFMRQAEQAAREQGRPLGEVVPELAAQQPRLDLAFPTTVEEVVSRIGVAPAAIKQLPPGTTGAELQRAVPELEAFRRQAGVEYVEKPSVGVGGWRSPTGEVFREGDADLLVRGTPAANRYFAAAWLAANPGEQSVMLAHTGPGVSGADSLASIELRWLPFRSQAEEMAALEEAVNAFSPEGWHLKVRLDRRGQQEAVHVVIAGVGKPIDQFTPEIRELVDDLNAAGYTVADSTVDAARVEFLSQTDVPEVLYGGPRGARVAGAAPAPSAAAAAERAAPVSAAGAEPAARVFGPGAVAPPVRNVAGPPAAARGAGGAELPRAAGFLPATPPRAAATAPAQDVERFYHGTAGAFDRPIAEKFDPNGLYGPGYYLTSDPRVAGGVIGPSRDLDTLDQLRRQLAAYEDQGLEGAADDVRDHIALVERRLENTTGGGLGAVEEGYAQSRAGLASSYQSEIDATQRTVDRLERDLQGKPADDYRWRMLDRLRARIRELQAELPSAGPNVRPVDVPRNLRLLDVDAPVAPEAIDAVATALTRVSGDAADGRSLAINLRSQNRDGVTGETLYEALKTYIVNYRIGRSPSTVGRALESAQLTNRILNEAGYDGIRYSGGQRIPMRDAAGRNIEHTAVVVFPESIDKLTNATARTPGGLIPGTPAVPPGARQIAGRAAVGGVGGALSEAEQEGATPETVARGALGGAALGAGRRALGRVAPELTAPTTRLAARAAAASRDFDLERLAQMRAEDLRRAKLPPPPPPPGTKERMDWLQGKGKWAPPEPPSKPSKTDTAVAVTVSNMLSGIGTAVQNTLGGIINNAWRPIETLGMGEPTAAARDVAAQLASVGEAFSRYARTFRTGERMNAPVGHESTLPSGWLRVGRVPVVPLAPFSVPLRNLSATDEFMGVLATSGAEASHVDYLMRKNPNLSFEEVLERFHDEIVKVGEEGQLEATFQTGGGIFGILGRKLSNARGRMMKSDHLGERAVGLTLQWLVPMSRVPGAILGKGVRAVPVINEVSGVIEMMEIPQRVGAARAVAKAGGTRGEQLGAALRTFDERQLRRSISRTYLTTFANMAILDQVVKGNITGNGPDNDADRARLMEAVDEEGNPLWRPNSIRIGGRWFDHTGLGPIGFSMGSIANLVDAATDYAQTPAEKRDPEWVPELGKELLKRQMQTISQAWYLRSIGELLGAFKEGRVENAASQVAMSGDRLVPMGGLLNEIRRLEDPYARQPDQPGERYLNRVPWLSRLVEPRLSATTGEPVEQPRDILSTVFRGSAPGMTPNPVAAEVSRLTEGGNRVSIPREDEMYLGAKQTPEQTRLIQRTVGQAVNMYVLDTMTRPAYANLTDPQKADALAQAVGQARAAAEIGLGKQVARSPKESALWEWATVPHFSGISGKLPPEEIARKNWEIEQAFAMRAAYRKQYGPDRGELLFRSQQPTANKLTERHERIEKEVLDAKKRQIDKAYGGVLLQSPREAEAGGLVGVGTTTLPALPPQR